MKNIFEILKEFGLEVPKDKEKDFEKQLLENYKTVTDYDTQVLKLNQANDTIKANDTTIRSLKKELEEFKDADVAGMKQKIADLETEKGTIQKNYEAQIADRDFGDLVKDCISAAKGKNTKAIMALLDVENLKKSKNQRDDVTAALKVLAEAEDSKMLFGDTPEPVGSGNPIGAVGGGGASDANTAQMRAIMGLPPVETK